MMLPFHKGPSPPSPRVVVSAFAFAAVVVEDCRARRKEGNFTDERSHSKRFKIKQG
jgi:hypothetical protein